MGNVKEAGHTTIYDSHLVLDFAVLVNAANEGKKPDEIQSLIDNLKTTWQAMHGYKTNKEIQYFSLIVIGPNGSTSGLVIKRDNLYVQGLFNPKDSIEGKDEVKAFVFSEEITYKDIANNPDLIIDINRIDTAFNSIAGVCSVDVDQLTDEKCRKVLMSIQGRLAIFCVAEAARFAFIQLCVISALVEYGVNPNLYKGLVTPIRNKVFSIKRRGFYKIDLYDEILTSYSKLRVNKKSGVISIADLREHMIDVYNKEKNPNLLEDMMKIGLIGEEDLQQTNK